MARPAFVAPQGDRPRGGRASRARAAAALAVAATCFLLLPAPAAAQLGAVEALVGRVSDLSFYGSVGRALPGSDALASEGPAGLASWGVELLFDVGRLQRPVAVLATAPDSGTATDTVELRWTEMRVERREGVADTIYLYEVERIERRPPMETLWTFELGIGYGQTVGFESTDPSLDLRGSIRTLPAVSLYASYEPWGGYLGVRSGFLRLDALQAIDEAGEVIRGEAETFLAAGVLGHAEEVLGLFLFVEAAYALRYFPSVEWDVSPLPAALPRSMQLSGWSIGLGVQFDVGG